MDQVPEVVPVAPAPDPEAPQKETQNLKPAATRVFVTVAIARALYLVGTALSEFL